MSASATSNAVGSIAMPDGLRMSDGQALFLRDWPFRTERKAVLLVHGLGEHSGRYEGLAQWLLARGYAVRSYDQRGHGQTSGPRGRLPRNDALLSDLAEVYRDYVQVCGFEPLLLGHSMGGLVALRTVLDRRITPPGLILSSPALRTHEPPTMQRLASVLEHIVPNLPLRTGLKADGLSHDRRVVEAYRQDPLCHGVITPRMAHFLFSAGKQCVAEAGSLPVTSVLLAAGSDSLVDAGGSREFATRAAPSGRLTTRFFDTLYHELFNEAEPARHQVLAQLDEWLRRQAPVV